MITKEKAVEIAIEYAKTRNRNYIYIETERVNYQENIRIPHGKYYEQKEVFIQLLAIMKVTWIQFLIILLLMQKEEKCYLL